MLAEGTAKYLPLSVQAHTCNSPWRNRDTTDSTPGYLLSPVRPQDSLEVHSGWYSWIFTTTCTGAGFPGGTGQSGWYSWILLVQVQDSWGYAVQRSADGIDGYLPPPVQVKVSLEVQGTADGTAGYLPPLVQVQDFLEVQGTVDASPLRSCCPPQLRYHASCRSLGDFPLVVQGNRVQHKAHYKHVPWVTLNDNRGSQCTRDHAIMLCLAHRNGPQIYVQHLTGGCRSWLSCLYCCSSCAS